VNSEAAAATGAGGRPHAGRRILVTRASDQAPALSRRLAELGAEVVEAPAIRLVEPPDWAPLDAALAKLGAYDWIVFTSQNTLPRLLARMSARGLGLEALRGRRLAAIGVATAAGLRGRGLSVAAVAEEFRAEGVVELLAREPLAGKRILLPRALVARDVLPETLRRLGAQVDLAPVYQTVEDPEGAAVARRALAAGGAGAPDAVTFTAASTVGAFLGALRQAGEPALLERLRGMCLASIGPITSDRLRAEGFAPTVEASPYTVPALVEALVAHFAAGVAPRPRRAATTEDR
jgi:uroporphyrinogen III methyltransferase/synthase